MSIKSFDAASAYAQALKGVDAGNSKSGNPFGAESASSSAFSNLIQDQLGDLKSATQNAEVTSAKALAGQADLVDVVTAASNAELVVSTMVAVRDKVVSSYNEIIKMPI